MRLLKSFFEELNSQFLLPEFKFSLMEILLSAQFYLLLPFAEICFCKNTYF